MKFQFIAKHRAAWRTRWMCAALGISHGGLYEWLRRPRSARARADDALLVHIRSSFEQSHRTYGSPRVWRDLHDWGIHCSVHRVARLMHLAGLHGRSRIRRRPGDSGDRNEALIAPNLLERQFQAAHPNSRWVADLPTCPPPRGWLFVAAVLDLFSRRIVGWSMSATMSAELVMDALLMAIWRRGSPRRRPHDRNLRLWCRRQRG